MVFSHIVSHGILYAVAVNGYLLLMMVTTNPRVWGYSDYPDEIKAKVPPQTKQEKRLGFALAVPWLIISFGFPIYSTFLLKADLGGDISFWTAFLNVLFMVFLAYLGDLVVLDWLIVSKITPDFVVIEGTEKAEYKDFSHHYTAQIRAAPVLVVVCLVFAAVVSYVG